MIECPKCKNIVATKDDEYRLLVDSLLASKGYTPSPKAVKKLERNPEKYGFKETTYLQYNVYVQMSKMQNISSRGL